ncbi:MAG: hypothetical protein ACI8W8_004190, partial [Rhodothermales bacterium]
HDPEADRYRIVTLRPDGASSLQGTWDAESATLQLDQLTDSEEHSRVEVKLEAANRVSFAGSTQTRAEFPPAKLIRRRSEGLRVLHNFYGSWSSQMESDTGEELANSAHAIWSRGQKGDFLIRTEGTHKAALTAFDPAARLYRSVELEAGGASFSHGRWHAQSSTMNIRFFAFELPRADDGKPLPDASFEDGLNGEIVDRVYHKFLRHLAMTARIGSSEIWKGKGKSNFQIDKSRVWAATLSGKHQGKGLIPGRTFERPHGFGDTLGFGPGPRALKLFFDNRSIRKFHRHGLWLNVNMNRFRAGETVNFWRNHRVRNQPHEWKANDDHTISPVKAQKLVLGWAEDNLRLVTRDSEDRLVFKEIGR